MSTVKRKITGSKSLFTLGSPSPIANTTLSESATKRSLISCAKLWWATNSLTVAIPLQWGRFALNPSPGPARRWWTSEANAGIPSERSAGRPWTPWSVLLGAEFVVFLFSLTLVLSPSIRQLFEVKTSLFEWKHCHISLKWWLFHPITLYEQKKVPFDDISWQLESERTRARGKRNYKFRTYISTQYLVIFFSKSAIIWTFKLALRFKLRQCENYLPDFCIPRLETSIQ